MRQAQVTITDRHRLKTSIFNMIAWVKPEQLDWIDVLDRKLDSAYIIFDLQDTPRDLVTMRSRVRLRDRTGKTGSGVYSMTYPFEDHQFPNAVSAVSALGVGILGERVGDQVQLPDGSGTVEIESVVYQPESEGHYYL